MGRIVDLAECDRQTYWTKDGKVMAPCGACEELTTGRLWCKGLEGSIGLCKECKPDFDTIEQMYTLFEEATV